MWLCGWGPLILNRHPARFGVHRPNVTGNNGVYSIRSNSNSNSISNAEVPMPRFTNGLYFWICKRNFSVEGDEGSIFSKAPDWQSLFKIKIEQTPGCPNKEYNAFFKHINQNVMTYPRRNLPEVFCKKDAYGNFAKCTGKHLCQSLFFNKV